MDAAAPRDVSGPGLDTAVAQVLSVGGDVAGAGFFAGEGVLVTCAHVVTAAGSGPDGRITLAFPHAPGAPQVYGEVLAESWRASEGQDVAVVRVDQVPDGVPLLPLGSAAGCRGHRVRSFGFPRQAPPSGHFGWGEAGDLLNAAGAGMLLQLTGANDLTTGFSGGPILDEVTGRVIGMLTAITAADERYRGVSIAYATPTEVLREVYPGLNVQQASPYRRRVRRSYVLSAVLVVVVAGGAATAVTVLPPPQQWGDNPTTVPTNCVGWSHRDPNPGTYGYMAGNYHMKSGPYQSCPSITLVSSGTKLWYYCYVVNDYGNKIWYARIASKTTEGWISADNLRDQSGPDTRC
jgi:hypothetical protein